LLGHVTRIARVGLARHRVDDVADDRQRRDLEHRVDVRGRRVRDQEHVRLLDLLEAADRGAVEPDPVLERRLRQLRHRDAEVLEGPREVRELEVHEREAARDCEIEDALRRRLDRLERFRGLAGDRHLCAPCTSARPPRPRGSASLRPLPPAVQGWWAKDHLRPLALRRNGRIPGQRTRVTASPTTTPPVRSCALRRPLASVAPAGRRAPILAPERTVTRPRRFPPSRQETVRRPRSAPTGWLAMAKVALAARRDAVRLALRSPPSRGAISLSEEAVVPPGPTRWSRASPGS